MDARTTSADQSDDSGLHARGPGAACGGPAADGQGVGGLSLWRRESPGRGSGRASRHEKAPKSGVEAHMRDTPPPGPGTLPRQHRSPAESPRARRAETGEPKGVSLAPGANRRDCGVARALSASPTANPVGAEREGLARVLFARSIGVDAWVEVLAANELQLLADKSLELADRYERDAAFMEDEDGRQIALALSRWRRCRGRYFRELSAEAERIEATHVDWARTCLGRHGPSAHGRLRPTESPD